MSFIEHLNRPPEPAPQPKPPKGNTIQELENLSLSDELSLNFQAAKALYAMIQHDLETPANQKAQVLNTITAILQSIVKMRTDLVNAERMKILEQTLIDTIKVTPQDVQDTFFEAYRRNLAPLQ